MRDRDRFIAPSTPPEVLGLREDVDAPDLSASILDEVDRRKGWLSRRQRRIVCAARWAGGAALLATFAAVLLVQRTTPVEEIAAPEERPLADLMRSFKDDASIAVQTVSSQVRSFPGRLVHESQEMVTGRMEHRGGRRVVDLGEGTATIVEEGAFGRVTVEAWLGAAHPDVLRTPAADAHEDRSRYRTIADGTWSLTVPGPDGRPVLLEATGIEPEAQRP